MDALTVTCESIYGNTVTLPREKLIFRPSAYAVLTWQGKLLMVNSRHAHKLCFPGGGLELGEPIEEALRREVREETGLEIEIERFFHFKEHFFYYDPTDEAFHGFMFFYLCRPATLELVRDELVDDGDSERPRWYDLDTLEIEQVLSPLREVVEHLREARQSRTSQSQD